MALGSLNHEDPDENRECYDTPSGLIIREFPQDVFIDDESKIEFEKLFLPYGDVSFTYLPGFQRIIVKFTNWNDALLAKEELHEKIYRNTTLKIYYKEEAKKLGEDFLKLPKADKLFLISPPASPPVGWEQVEEPIPVVNYDLVSAVAGLEVPGKPVELVSRTDSTPSIIVVGCENPEPTGKPLKSMLGLQRDEVQTKRPPLPTN